jgi:putative chitinase
MEWAGLGPAWYWTVARPDINALCDAGDLYTVTQRINGGQNGAPDRAARYNMAGALGDQLLQLLSKGDDFMPALTDDEQHELLDLARQQAKYRRPSLSPLRWPHEGDVNTCAGFAWATDGNLHVMLVEKLAVDYGDAPAIALLYAVAHTDEPGRDSDKVLANKILAKVAPADITAAQGQIKSWLDAEAAHHAA